MDAWGGQDACPYGGNARKSTENRPEKQENGENSGITAGATLPPP